MQAPRISPILEFDVLVSKTQKPTLEGRHAWQNLSHFIKYGFTLSCQQKKQHLHPHASRLCGRQDPGFDDLIYIIPSNQQHICCLQSVPRRSVWKKSPKQISRPKSVTPLCWSLTFPTDLGDPTYMSIAQLFEVYLLYKMKLFCLPHFRTQWTPFRWSRRWSWICRPGTKGDSPRRQLVTVSSHIFPK